MLTFRSFFQALKALGVPNWAELWGREISTKDSAEESCLKADATDLPGR